MAHHGIFMLLEKYPQLRPKIKQGRYLLGYTDGSGNDEEIPVFLLRSPWTQFCIWATTDEVAIPAGGVLVITDDPEWSVESHWKAYSLVTPAVPNPSSKKSRQNQSQAMTTLAAEIAREEAKNASSQSRKMTQEEVSTNSW